jgi:hypothetical protein
MNKKVVAIVTAVVLVVAIVAGTIIGSNAFFVDDKKNTTTGVAGEVTIADEQISISNISAYITGNGVDIDMGEYWDNGGSAEGSHGWVAEKSTTISEYTPVWAIYTHKTDDGWIEQVGSGIYSCSECGTELSLTDSNVRHEYMYPNFFRTKDGEVAYCLDNGKTEPSDGVCNMSTPVPDKIKRVLMKGYPQASGSDYDISDAELEWCTQQALYIVEGTYYDKDGNLVDGDEAKLSDFYTWNFPISGKEEEAAKLLSVIEELVDYSTDSSIDITSFQIDASKVGTQSDADNYIVGPYAITSNVSGDITLTASDNSVSFQNASGDAITTVASNEDFYVLIPKDVKDDVTFTAEAATSILPTYYYWSGRATEQKMAVASLMPAKVTAHVNTVDELMPGDVVDLSWVVENIGNKSILTRNTVYLYWEYDGTTNTDEANGLDMTYLYKQNTSASDIRADMLTKNPSLSSLIDMGEKQEFTLNGETHTGYKFTVYGDAIDGVGTGAETGISSEVDYGSEYDDTSTTSDLISYKLALSQWANINTSGQKLKIAVVTEAMQYQNTTDDDWQQVGYTELTVN